MKLFFIIIALIALGVVAAFSASLLVRVSSGQGFGGSSPPSELEILVTTTSLPAMSVVNSSHITKDKVPSADLPAGYLTSPVQAIGRVLAMPLVEGQILTQSCFVTEGTAAQLAAALPEGMRAFTVTLARQSISGGFLYPGCVVDIVATFRLPGREVGEAVATTLLEGIQVLAVRDLSVVAMQTNETERGPARGVPAASASRQELTVTLMVDSGQAEALQLAVEYGKISVAMRNPLDKRPVDSDTTVLSQGTLAKLGSALEPRVAARMAQMAGQPFDPNDPNALIFAPANKANAPAKKPSWLITVIRGQEVEEKQMETPGGGGAEANTKK